VICHQATGKGAPPAFPPLDGSKVVTGPKEALIKTILNGVMRDGKPTAMPAWGGTLSDVDIAAVATYAPQQLEQPCRDAIQPAEVAAARKDDELVIARQDRNQ
jgi:cytochrome c oxidase subunit 2